MESKSKDLTKSKSFAKVRKNTSMGHSEMAIGAMLRKANQASPSGMRSFMNALNHQSETSRISPSKDEEKEDTLDIPDEISSSNLAKSISEQISALGDASLVAFTVFKKETASEP